jgi:amino acid adenylation domain-containing protein
MGSNVLDRPVFSAFAEVAAGHAGKTAVRDAAGAVSYGELLERVTSLAAHLAQRGDRGDPVGIALPMGADIPAAMLACLAVGRPYVPLDLRHPAERKNAILRHAGCRTILVSGAAPGEAGPIGAGGAELIDVRRAPAVPTGWKPAAVPEDLAYVLYTSGSTGTPKGVCQDQRGLLHDVRQYTDSVHLSATDVCSLFYSPSVNGAIRDIYGALLNGAELCMTDLLAEGYAEALGRTGAAGMTVFHAMPPVLRSLLRGGGVAGAMSRVRLAYVAGDRFFGSDLKLLRRVMPAGAFLYTGIGSTECATLYRQWFVPGDWEVGDGEVLPVGYAVPDRTVELRDEAGGVVGPGERGEIHVRSRHVARGYWREPELTASVFQDLGDGIREFRTGDCGVLRSDGLLAFGGRGDRQVKVRGFRVEPGEVEAQLRAMEGVREAGVAVNQAGRLIAFVELEADGAADASGAALREQLLGRLPGHLVPWEVSVLASLPRLANLKIDHAALQRMADAESPGARDESTVAAAAQVSRTSPQAAADWLSVVMEAWTRSCGRRPQSAVDEWQHAGGDSLQALELLVALERKAGRKLPASTVGPGATPESMARQIAHGDGGSERPSGRLPGTFWLVTWAPGASLHDRALVDAVSDLVSGEVLELTTLEEELERIRTIPGLAEECAERIARSALPGSDVYLMGISFGSRVAMELGSVLLRRGYAVRYVAVCDIAPVSGFDVLARQAEELKMRRIGDAPYLCRLRLRLLAEARWWLARRVQGMARRGWKRGLRWTARVGGWLLGRKFTEGVKAAIRRAQASRWQPAWYPQELTLLLTAGTGSLFPGASPTLGWERHAASVKLVTIPGDHFTCSTDEFADGFAQLLRTHIREAAGQERQEFPSAAADS